MDCLIPHRFRFKEPTGDRPEHGVRARQTGGRGQYGHVLMRISPNEPGKGYELIGISMDYNVLPARK